MPDLPGATDEPYDSRFVKWMIKNKVGWASAGAPRIWFYRLCTVQGCPTKGLMGQNPAQPLRGALVQGCIHFKE